MIKVVDNEGRIIKKSLKVNTTDIIELTLTKGDKKLILFRSPVAYVVLTNSIMGNSIGLTEVEEIKKRCLKKRQKVIKSL